MDRFTFAADGGLEGNTLTFTAHVFGTRTVRGGVVHEFAPGAFDESIKAGEVIAFYSHDTTKPLASQSAGSLNLSTKGGALTGTMALGEQSYAHDLRINARDGLMASMSFGVLPDKWTDERAADGATVRLHTRSRLFDVSPVTIPAFSETQAQLHSPAGPRDWPGSQAVRARSRVAKRRK